MKTSSPVEGRAGVVTRLVQVICTGLIASIALLSGCNSCERGPEAPAPVAKEGRLPRAPEPEVTAPPSVVAPPACAVVAGSSVEEGVAPLTVQFSTEGMCTDAAGVFTWDFGDGSKPTHEPNVTHVYTKPGSYTARVTLADEEHGASDTDEAPVAVTAP
jgi:hypothetical protein